MNSTLVHLLLLYVISLCSVISVVSCTWNIFFTVIYLHPCAIFFPYVSFFWPGMSCTQGGETGLKKNAKSS